MRHFPDPQSCLREGSDATERQDLLQMDWDRIDTIGDAKVCIFRLLHVWGGADAAALRLEAQGFRVGTGAGVYQPHRTHDGKLRVGGGWSIRRNGPRFPTTGVIRRSLRATPCGMRVSATFSGDGAELLYVSINFSTL
ncbi:hypothetical protein ACSQ76_02790 [Roseovarius sp. B08]|uniref:hypothetical protein n=1 Tax=Roseovarius sp. B08 TaxID=3449223 RepID=UPI003EDC2C4B